MAERKNPLIAKRREQVTTYTTASGQVKTTKRSYRSKDEATPMLFNLRVSKKNKGKYNLNEKNWNAFIESIEYADMADDEKITLIAELNREKNAILKETFDIDKKGQYRGLKYASSAQHGWNRIDAQSMLSRVNENATERFLINLGFSKEELADSLDVSVDEIMNRGNWGKDGDGNYTFTSKDGRVWTYEYKYNDTVFVRKFA